MAKRKEDYFAAGRESFVNQTAGPKSGWQYAAWREGWNAAADDAAVSKKKVNAAAARVFKEPKVYADAHRKRDMMLARLAWKQNLRQVEKHSLRKH